MTRSDMVTKLLLAVFFLTPSLVSASEVILKSGQKLEGKIVEQTDKYIKIDTGIGLSVTYYRDEIDKINTQQAHTPAPVAPPAQTASPSKEEDPTSIPGWELVWDDEFTGDQVDSAKWSFETGNGDNGWGNGQLDYARPDNIEVKDGQLVLTVKKEDYEGFHYTSTRMVTKDKMDFQYGRIEIRAKVLDGQGVGTAFWMLGSNFRDPDWTWPKCGEVDIFEIAGRDPGFSIGTAHYAEKWGHQTSQGRYRLPDGEKFSDDYHTFSIEWDENKIDWYVDSEKINTLDISRPFNGLRPFNNKFFLVLNTTVGGNFWGAPNDSTEFPMTAYVKWVRVYKKEEE